MKDTLGSDNIPFAYNDTEGAATMQENQRQRRKAEEELKLWSMKVGFRFFPSVPWIDSSDLEIQHV